MNKLNKFLSTLGIKEQLVQGRGYVYFVDGEAHTWYGSSIAVCWMRDLCTIVALSEWVTLAGDYANHERHPGYSAEEFAALKALAVGLEHIALNDNAADTDANSIAGYTSVAVLAVVTQQTPKNIGKWIADYRLWKTAI